MARIGNFIADQFMTQLASSEFDANAFVNELNDPTYLEFIVIPHFNVHHGLFADEKYVNSALAYLKRVGELDRYEMLKTFIDEFQTIMNESMWMFKSISGLDAAMNRKMSEPLLVDSKLSFTAYETVDWRMQALLQLWKSICYDTNDRFVEILPENLRTFYMSIYLRDIRVLANDSNGKNARDFGRTIDHLDIELTACNHRMLHFGHCELAISNASSSHLSELSTSEYSPAEITFDIEYRTFNESSKFRTVLGDVEISSSIKNVETSEAAKESRAKQFKNKISARVSAQAQAVTSAFKEFVDPAKRAQQLASLTENTANQAVNQVVGRVTGAVNQKFLLGNVYELDLADAMFFAQLDANALSRLKSENVFGK